LTWLMWMVPRANEGIVSDQKVMYDIMKMCRI